MNNIFIKFCEDIIEKGAGEKFVCNAPVCEGCPYCISSLCTLRRWNSILTEEDVEVAQKYLNKNRTININTFDINKFEKESMCIYCNSKEEAIDFANVLKEYRIKWDDGSELEDDLKWSNNGDKWYLLNINRRLSCVGDLCGNILNYKIYKWKIEPKKYLGWEILKLLSEKKLEENTIIIDNNKTKYIATHEALVNYTNGEYVTISLLSNSSLYYTIKEIKKEIDWSKVPKGVPVKVKDTLHDVWGYKYFYKYFNRSNYRFRVSNIKEDDPYTGIKMKDYTGDYRYCKIHESVDIPEEWYK